MNQVKFVEDSLYKIWRGMYGHNFKLQSSTWEVALIYCQQTITYII